MDLSSCPGWDWCGGHVHPQCCLCMFLAILMLFILEICPLLFQLDREGVEIQARVPEVPRKRKQEGAEPLVPWKGKAFPAICFEWSCCPKCQDVLKDSWVFGDECPIFTALQVALLLKVCCGL